ncbi:Gfo/Idh/MocA family protein [Elstera litoralis]|uniref:Gfo/Idh/MocA family protein n=1 Tax=Elstera litoralis TaxID=552518 RepID=UPI000697D0DD|nr:Gfo/Idh/MocA family oxidoreductase [Elstera litoralis]
MVIAASSAAHAGLAQAVIAAGKPLLIEKPFAVTLTEAEAVISAAERAGVPVATGHVERFNPAFVAAQKLLHGRRILAIDGRRLNVGSNRILDTDVVIDLMIHDIDAAVALMGGVPEGLMAQGFALAEGVAKRDHVLAAWTQRTPTPIRVSMQGSRIVPDRVRETRVLTEEGMVVIDFLNRRVQASECLLPDGQSEGRSLVPVAVQPQESLAAELTQFLDGVRAGRPEAVGVTVQAALPVLNLVWAIQDQLYGA